MASAAPEHPQCMEAAALTLGTNGNASLPEPALLPCPGTLHCPITHTNFCITILSWELDLCNPSFQSSSVKDAHKSFSQHHFTPDTFVVELELPNGHCGWARLLLPWRRMCRTIRTTTGSVPHHPSSGRRISPHPRSSPEFWTIHGMTPHQ